MNTTGAFTPARALLATAIAFTVLASCSGDDKYKKVVVVGDSLSEGYQTGTCFYATQPSSFAVRVAYKTLRNADEEFELPLLTLPNAADPIGGRRRIDPEVVTRNLGVGGADTHDVVATQATAQSEGAIRTEFDRVLFPRTGTQIDAAVAEDPDLVILWIGSNDALGAATTPGSIDGVFGLTPVDSVRADLTTAVRRLKETDADIVLGNIPPITAISYLLPGPVLGLPAQVRIPLPIALGVASGALPPEVLANPNNLLDAGEEARIEAHITALNQAIDQVASAEGVPVVDINAYFKRILATQPITIAGPAGSPSFRISASYAPRFSATGTSGAFSLDGVHPSNTGYALAANEFIKVINAEFDKDLEEVDVWTIAARDPYVDKDGDGCITGPGFLSLPGITGDSNDANPAVNECRAATKLSEIGTPILLPMASPLSAGGWSAILNRN